MRRHERRMFQTEGGTLARSRGKREQWSVLRPGTSSKWLKKREKKSGGTDEAQIFKAVMRILRTFIPRAEAYLKLGAWGRQHLTCV